MVFLFFIGSKRQNRNMLNIINNYLYSFSQGFVLFELIDMWYWVIRGIIVVLIIVGNGFVVYFIVFKWCLCVINNWFVLFLVIVDFCIGLFVILSGFICMFQFWCDWRVQIIFYNFLFLVLILNLWVMVIDRYIVIVYFL